MVRWAIPAIGLRLLEHRRNYEILEERVGYVKMRDEIENIRAVAERKIER